MRTTFRIKQPYVDIFLSCANDQVSRSPARPHRFIEKMLKNQGSIALISGYGLDDDGLERKNPVVVGLGDSVTAGHFECLLPEGPDALQDFARKAQLARLKGDARPAIEITDARESYLEKFHLKLIDKFERTSVSVINAGIAGDNLIQMAARADRDVIRYQPDLVLINGSLNWDAGLGTVDVYSAVLTGLVRKIKQETSADIVLLTPNGDLPNTLFGDANPPSSSLPERVQVIRKVAESEQTCLADVYAVWEAARDAGCPWDKLLANGVNHPSVEGHDVYAIILMRLLD